jgi:uncharacterized membrane protein YdjX (TVP38/TMEM64 family)
VLNYALALTCLSSGDYALATALALLPYVALYGYLGSVSPDVVQVGAGDSGCYMELSSG